MASARYTTEEIIALLKRSNLKTVIAEGSDDVEVLRNLEDQIKNQVPGVDFLDAGGKPEVMRIHSRRSELPPNSSGFLVDQDLWLFTDENNLYQSLITVDGYSIENDCLRCDSILNLVQSRPQTREYWNKLLDILTKWFSIEASRALSELPYVTNTGIELILDSNSLTPKFDEAKRLEGVPSSTYSSVSEKVTSNPLRYLPGKILVQAIKRTLEEKENLPIPKRGLLAIGSKNPNPYISRLSEEITKCFLAL